MTEVETDELELLIQNLSNIRVRKKLIKKKEAIEQSEEIEEVEDDPHIKKTGKQAAKLSLRKKKPHEIIRGVLDEVLDGTLTIEEAKKKIKKHSSGQFPASLEKALLDVNTISQLNEVQRQIVLYEHISNNLKEWKKKKKLK